MFDKLAVQVHFTPFMTCIFKSAIQFKSEHKQKHIYDYFLISYVAHFRNRFMFVERLHMLLKLHGFKMAPLKRIFYLDCLWIERDIGKLSGFVA